MSCKILRSVNFFGFFHGMKDSKANMGTTAAVNMSDGAIVKQSNFGKPFHPAIRYIRKIVRMEKSCETYDLEDAI